jgi:4-amino-4-deoxy-L-arabinose transferase-like glycosyltransferase
MSIFNGGIYQIDLWLKTHVIVPCLVVLVFSASPRVFFALHVDLDRATTYYSDAPTYLVPAHSILERGEFLDKTGQPYVHRTPGYPAFLSAIMFVFGQNLRTVLIVQSVFLASSVVVLYLLARLILPQLLAFVGGVFAALSPWSIILGGIPMSDGLFLALLVLIFYLMRLTVGSRESVSLACGGIWIGLLTGFAVLVRPLWILIPMIAIAFIYLYGRNRKYVWCLSVLVLIFASLPPMVWMQRNARELAFHGLSDITGLTLWHYLAARVRSELTGVDKSLVSVAADREIEILKLSVQDADRERWRRSMVLFREHPLLTAYCFIRSAIEHSLNPSPDGLRVARLRFYGDYWILALLWGGLLFLSIIGFYYLYNHDGRNNIVQFPWLFAILIVCSVLTLCSGVSFHAGSRLRAPMEMIVPLLAGAGLPQMKRLLKLNRIF